MLYNHYEFLANSCLRADFPLSLKFRPRLVYFYSVTLSFFLFHLRFVTSCYVPFPGSRISLEIKTLFSSSQKFSESYSIGSDSGRRFQIGRYTLTTDLTFTRIFSFWIMKVNNFAAVRVAVVIIARRKRIYRALFFLKRTQPMPLLLQLVWLQFFNGVHLTQTWIDDEALHSSEI